MITMKKQIANYYPVLCIVLFIIAVNVVFYFYGPDQIVRTLGVRNTYLIAFGTAAIGGLSTATGVVMFTLIASFAAGGATPWLLGVCGGLGIFVSDSVFFWLAQVGRESMPPKWKRWIARIHHWMHTRPKWLVMTAVYLYLGLTPFPSDLIMIVLVLGKYRYRSIVPVLLAGSLTIATLTAYIGHSWW